MEISIAGIGVEPLWIKKWFGIEWSIAFGFLSL